MQSLGAPNSPVEGVSWFAENERYPHRNSKYSVCTRLKYMNNGSHGALTSVSLKNLKDFARLQVPYVYFGIFAAAYDVFVTCKADRRRNAVCPIRVAHVGLDTPRCLIIPETDCRILRRNQYKPGVR
jgi:hypothetical protein